MVYTFHCANSHLEMLLNEIVSVMVLDAYTITDTDPITPKMANTNISIWYLCIPSMYIGWAIYQYLFELPYTDVCTVGIKTKVM